MSFGNTYLITSVEALIQAPLGSSTAVIIVYITCTFNFYYWFQIRGLFDTTLLNWSV
jgi:hypothetical protein